MKKFALIITAPTGPLFEGEAGLVTVPAQEGVLGFLAHHADYLVGLKEGDIRIFAGASDPTPVEVISIQGGHAFFQNNRCIICTQQ